MADAPTLSSELFDCNQGNARNYPLSQNSKRNSEQQRQQPSYTQQDYSIPAEGSSMKDSPVNDNSSAEMVIDSRNPNHSSIMGSQEHQLSKHQHDFEESRSQMNKSEPQVYSLEHNLSSSNAWQQNSKSNLRSVSFPSSTLNTRSSHRPSAHESDCPSRIRHHSGPRLRAPRPQSSTPYSTTSMQVADGTSDSDASVDVERLYAPRSYREAFLSDLSLAEGTSNLKVKKGKKKVKAKSKSQRTVILFSTSRPSAC